MVRRSHARDPTRNHGHVVTATVRRHDHARGTPDEQGVVLHGPRPGAHDGHEPTGRLARFQIARPDKSVEQTSQVSLEVLPRPEAHIRAMRFRDNPRIASRGEIAEEHVRGVAEIAVRRCNHGGSGLLAYASERPTTRLPWPLRN